MKIFDPDQEPIWLPGRADCEAFNRDFPVGSKIEYYPVLPDGPAIVATTRSEAFLSESGAPVVFIDERVGCVSILHCKKPS